MVPRIQMREMKYNKTPDGIRVVKISRVRSVKSLKFEKVTSTLKSNIKTNY